MTLLQDTYLTVAGESMSTIREKASRFMAFAFPVAEETEIKGRLESLRKKYFSADHHCYAFRLGHPDESVSRMNDDGEPSGSAGRPIYGQILSRQLSDVLVVVIRYFGGTKLGLPGLTQAYRSAASSVLEECRIVPKVLYKEFQIIFPVQRINEVMRILKQEDAEVISQDFDNKYYIRFSVRRSRSEDTRTRLTNLTSISIY